MAAKFFALALLVVAAQANVEHSSFSYGVKDPHTGDVKDQHEKRVGDSVVGQYSLLESDGTKRIVDYAANPHTGFNAVVRKEGLSIHPVAPVAHHGAYAAPALAHSYAAPATVGYSSTVAHGGYAAPYAAYGGYAGHGAYGSYAGQGAYGGYAGQGAYGGYAAGLGYAGQGAYGYGAPLAAGYGGYGYGAGLGW